MNQELGLSVYLSTYVHICKYGANENKLSQRKNTNSLPGKYQRHGREKLQQARVYKSGKDYKSTGRRRPREGNKGCAYPWHQVKDADHCKNFRCSEKIAGNWLLLYRR